MAGIFEFDGRVNLAKLFNWLGSLEGTTDGEVFEGETANGKVQLRAEGSFVEDGGAIFGDVTLVVMERDGAPLGGFAGPASLDAAGGGLIFDAALAGGGTGTAGPGRGGPCRPRPPARRRPSPPTCRWGRRAGR